MKYLETLKTRPHSGFVDLTDSYIKSYLRENFEIVLENLDSLKDIINMYSYVLEGCNPKFAFKIKHEVFLVDYFELHVPDDMDIINAACAVYVKMSAKNSNLKFKFTEGFTYEHVEDDLFVKNLLLLETVGSVSTRDIRKMRALTDIIDVPTHKYFDSNFMGNVVNRRYTVRKLYEVETLFGCVYIDYSMSIYNDNLHLFRLFKNNLPFKNNKEVKLSMFSVTSGGIKFIGEATNAEEFMYALSTTIFESGIIDINKVIKHMKGCVSNITFITDTDDFEIIEFKKQVNNCNIITINGRGKIIKA